MIISASRRTDIPACYSDWFMNRIRDGHVCVRNPFQTSQATCVELDQLKASGKRILMATAKPDKFTDMVLEKFDLAKYFEFVGSATMDGSRVQKADIIKYVLESCNVTDLEHTIMIGDRDHDILGANVNGIDSIGVLYGFGDREELETAGATYLVDKALDVAKLLA